jgi:polysaccharide biosynthesis transport protein
VLAALLLTLIADLFATPNYTATSTVLIEPETAQVLDSREPAGDPNGTEAHDYYKTEFEVLKSRDLAKRVIREVGLDHNPVIAPNASTQGFVAHIWAGAISPVADFLHSFQSTSRPAPSGDPRLENMIDRYLKRLDVIPVIGTRLVTVTFTMPDRDLAAKVVDQHLDDYIKQELDRRSLSRRSVREFLEGQLDEIKQQVESSEAALNSYRHSKGIVSFEVGDKNEVAQNRMATLTKALTEAETTRIGAEAQMNQVRAGDYQSLPQVVTNQTIAELEPQVALLQSEYASLAAAFNPAYPKLAELKAKLDTAQGKLDAEIDEVARSVKRNYAAALAQEKELKGEIAQEKEQDLALNDDSLKDAILARQVQTNQQLYKLVLGRIEEMTVGEQAPVANVSIVDHPAPPAFRSSPKILKSLLIGGLIASVIGIALAFLLDHLDNRLKSSQEVESYLHLPHLATAPDFGKLLKGLPGNLSDWLTYGGRAEVYRSIRTALLFSRAGAPPRRILITSAVEGEGKTWTAVHTALAFARTDAKTLLIDADLRRPRCHSLLGVANTPGSGLSDVLAAQCDPEERVRHLEEHKLHLLTAGSSVPNPAELLTSARMMNVLESLAKRYHYIVIDSPPVMTVSETAGLATMTDGVVIVAGAHTPKHRILSACERVYFVGARILGVVLNRVDIRHPGYQEEFHHYYELERYEGRPVVAPELEPELVK